MDRIVRCTVGAEVAGLSLASWLAERFRYADESAWRSHCEAGRLSVNTRPAGPDSPLHAGDEVQFSPPADLEPPVDESYSIVFERDGLLVIDKPAGLPVHPSGRFFHATLWRLMLERYPEFHVITRLDRETSGLLLAATRREAARRASAFLEEGLIRKRYLAIVHGSFPDEALAKGWLVKDGNSAVRKKLRFVREISSEREGQTARSCETRFKTREHASGFSLVEAALITGRTHQIRSTLLSMGHPIVGDKLYGLNEAFFIRFSEGRLGDADKAALILKNQALHSTQLVFPGLDGYVREFESPPPWPFPPAMAW